MLIYYYKDGKFEKLYPRINLMKECYRTLKKGGLLHMSTSLNGLYWAQDPTHVDVPSYQIQLSTFVEDGERVILTTLQINHMGLILPLNG